MTPRNEIEIIVTGRDEIIARTKKDLKGLEAQGKTTSKSLVQSFRDYRGAILGVTAAIAGATLATKEFIEASSKVEQYKTRLEGLLGTVEAGNRVFADMAFLAGQVPKTYDEIMASATNLAGVVRNGEEEIKQLMPIIVDISAATGMTVQEVTGQMIRMYSAGAASADMFRERGISAALGFQAGMSYSAEETMRTILQQWEDGTGKFVGASKKLADTWEGQMSMMADATFKLKAALGDFITQSPEVIDAFGGMTTAVNAFAEGLRLLRKEDWLTDYMRNIGRAIAETAYIFKYQDTIESILQKSEQLGASAGQFVFPGTPGADTSEASGSQEKPRSNQLAEETAYWAERAQLVIEGNNTINQMIQEASDWKKQVQLEDKLFFVQNEMEKTKVMLETAKLDEKTQKKLYDYKTKLALAEVALNKQIREQDTKAAQQGYSDTLSMLKQTLQMGAQESRSMAIALQAVRIGETVVNTATAVMRAYADMPFPMNIGVAAATAAMGATQVGIIASQGFNEGTDSVPAMLTPGEMVVPRTFANAVRNGDLVIGGNGAGTPQSIHIEMTNPVFWHGIEDFKEQIIEAVSDALAREAARI